MQYGIVVFPTKDVQDAANSYRKRYDPHYQLIQPHLTVREKEEWSETRLAEAVEQLEQVTQQLAPFDLRFERFSSFYPANPVIYMALADPQPMLVLHKAVCGELLSQSGKPYHYTPHLTIGQHMGADELHDVWASLKRLELGLTTRIDRLHLVHETDNSAWTVHQTFVLRG